MKIIYLLWILLGVSNLTWLVLFVHIRRSYKKLMRKSMENEGGVQELVKIACFEQAKAQNEHEKTLLDELNRMLDEEKIYLNPSLTIQELALKLGTNKTTLSHVINSDLNQNFASLLNGYRVRESITVLSNPLYFQEKLEVVGEMCGFNNRQVFHAAFKKEMGITPNHFRNIQKATVREEQRNTQ